LQDLKNYRLIIEYDGTDYYGWQIQKTTDETIQAKIEKSIEIILKEKIRIIASGRTDTGVHALNQVANFKTNLVVNDANKFLYSVNSILPKSITLKNIQLVPLSFHSRYSAFKREYKYQISFKRKSVYKDYFYVIDYKLNFDLIDQAIKFFKEDNYFKSLCKNKSDKHNFRCFIYKLNYKIKKEELTFNIIANRFLHSMVRGLLGCLIDIGRGHLDINETFIKIRKGENINIKFLPSNALFLKKIYY
jgi:tRNA pseudouridine38-40 synthase